MPTPVGWRSVWTSLAVNAGTVRPPRSTSVAAGASAAASAAGAPAAASAGAVPGAAAVGAGASAAGLGGGAAPAPGRRPRRRCRRPRRRQEPRQARLRALGGGRGCRRQRPGPGAAGAGRGRRRRAVLGDEPAFGHGVGDDPAEQGTRADGVVVARDHVGDHVGVAVGVDDGDDRQSELVGLGDRDVLLLGVDHEDGVGQLVEAADAAEVALELLELTGVAQRLLLRHGVEVAGLLHGLELLHALHPGGDGLEVGEHAAQPALVHVGHAAGVGVDGDGSLGLLLRPDEEDGAAPGDEVPDVPVGLLDTLHGLLEIDEVDPVALAEDEATHLRVPPAGLVPEVDARAQQLLHGDDGHSDCSL